MPRISMPHATPRRWALRGLQALGNNRGRCHVTCSGSPVTKDTSIAGFPAKTPRTFGVGHAGPRREVGLRLLL